MADGDFDYLQADVAALLGIKAISSLPANELAQAKALINEGYRQCFIRPSGKRVRWAAEYLGFLLPAPVTFTFTATNGSASIASVSGVTLSASYAGSRIKIGEEFYTLASATAMVEPWSGTTGIVTATIYYSSYVLPVENLDLAEEPEVLGWGRLAPMAGAGQEIRNRNYGTGDFQPESGESPKFAGYKADMQTGDPLFYYIDSASLVGAGASASMQNRFTVYPLPDTSARTVRVRGNYVPAALSAGADMPRMPANAIVDTLLPIARGKIVAVVRRFYGTNGQEILRQAALAEQKLDSLSNAQKRKPARVVVKEGW